jgi:predicted TIM-barrel fold metal-dependent hydrolase
MSCCGMHIPEVGGATIDFPTDTTRTITSLAFGGAFARYGDVKFIFSHGGGTLPMIIQRFGTPVRNLKPEERQKILPDGFEALVKKQYYDIASVAMNPGGMAAVLNVIPTSQLFYGSDAPFGSTTVIAERLAKFDLPAAAIKAIRRDNALRLFPRFAA